ncbi:hypothetical protein [Paucibacter sp. XJ19-41]|uniref:hypothetical protein n=1 Tax=Paucibacter sp. XJ19-41 TaxID=2927824 RepID=UPI00234ABB12|nr:hypothetical protein [Paucibacter sp. XJ19-41]
MGRYLFWLAVILFAMLVAVTDGGQNWKPVSDLFGNNAFGTLLGALIGAAGALGGSWLAHREAEKAVSRRELLAEIRSTNVAIAMASSFVNSFASTKKQHIKPLADSHKTEREQLELFFRARQHQPDLKHRLVPNLSLILPLKLSSSSLQNLFINQLSVTGRPLGAMMMLAEYSKLLDDSIAGRNDLLEEIRQGQFRSIQLAAFLHGLPGEQGRDGRYDGTITALCLYVDTCIFASRLLCEDLMLHGKLLADQAVAKHGMSRPKINRVELIDEKLEGLLPETGQFADWLRGYPNAPG